MSEYLMQYLIGSYKMHDNGEVRYVDKPIRVVETETGQ